MVSGADSSRDVNDMVAKADLRRNIRNRIRVPFGCGRDWLDAFKKISPDYSVLIGYMPLSDEPDCMAILQWWLESGRVLYLPVFDETTKLYGISAVGGLDSAWLVRGKYGILEPRGDIERRYSPFIFDCAALWLVPGLAFGLDGARLGRGAGYYDRLLAGTNAVKCGTVHSSRLEQSIPVLEHDIKMDCLLLENGPVWCI